MRLKWTSIRVYLAVVNPCQPVCYSQASVLRNLLSWPNGNGSAVCGLWSDKLPSHTQVASKPTDLFVMPFERRLPNKPAASSTQTSARSGSTVWCTLGSSQCQPAIAPARRSWRSCVTVHPHKVRGSGAQSPRPRTQRVAETCYSSQRA